MKRPERMPEEEEESLVRGQRDNGMKGGKKNFMSGCCFK